MELKFPSCEPKGGLPPAKGDKEIEIKMPERIEVSQMCQFMGEHHLLLGGGKAAAEIGRDDHGGTKNAECNGRAQACRLEESDAAGEVQFSRDAGQEGLRFGWGGKAMAAAPELESDLADGGADEQKEGQCEPGKRNGNRSTV